MRGEALDDLATQSADDALVAVLAKLDDFRGDEPLHHLGVQVRAARGGRPAAPARLAGPRDAARAGRLGRASAATGLVAARATSRRASCSRALRAAIDEQLTPHQREVLVAITIAGVPIDVLAERLDTTRGALYKTLHDARQKLRACLAEQGFDIGGVAA